MKRLALVLVIFSIYASASTPPTVTTTTAYFVGYSTAWSGGTVTSGGPVISEGVCWGLSANPTTPCTSDGTATSFTSVLGTVQLLSPGTTYHYRAFATNNVGTGYGADATFTTSYSLPTTWVDNNELTCLLTGNCYTGSPGLSLTAPLYELTLGASAGTWGAGGAPPGFCSFTLAHYQTTASGLQYAINDIEGCRTAGLNQTPTPINVGIILDVPPSGYYVNPSASIGYLVPQTSTTLAGAPLIVRSSAYATLAAMPEPVCAGGIQDNVSESTNPGLNNPDCTGTNMYYENAPQNPCLNGACPGTITGLVQISVNTTTLASITAGGPQLVPLTNGYVSPVLDSSITAYTSPCTALKPVLIYDPTGGTECVLPVSGVNQTGLYATFVNSHASGVCVLFNVTSAEVALTGNTVCTGVSNGTGAFTLQKTGASPTNISAYNYFQYMPQIETSAVPPYTQIPLQLCSPVASGTAQCSGSIGPDHWLFEDLAVSLTPGNKGNQFIIETGQAAPANATSFSQFAHDIHFRRVWSHGDWTSLLVGANAVADGFDLSGCYYCSIIGSQVGQALRPSQEGHSILLEGNILKIANNWLEGSSVGAFAGGEASPPIWNGYIRNTDIEDRRNRNTFPFSWLGMSKVPASNPNYTSGNYSVYRKNCHEFKEGFRILDDGLICENVDGSGGQGGINYSDATRSISGQHNGAVGSNYNVWVHDLTASNMILRNSLNGFTNVGGRSVNSSGGISWPEQRLSFSNVLGYSITDQNPGGLTGLSYGARLDNGSQSWNVTMSGNGSTATAVGFASVDAGQLATYTFSNAGGNTTYLISGGSESSDATTCGSPFGSVDDGIILSGSLGTLTDAKRSFASTMVGSAISVAGAAGSGNPLLTTIATVPSSGCNSLGCNTVTLTTPATVAVSGAEVQLTGAYIYVYGFNNSNNNATAGTPPTGFQCVSSGTALSGVGAMTAGGGISSCASGNPSCILTDSSNPFTTAMVGIGITVPGAGAGGAALATSIQSYNNSGSVVLAAKATTSVSAATPLTLTTLVLANSSGVPNDTLTTSPQVNQNNANPIISSTSSASDAAATAYQVFDILQGDPVFVYNCGTTPAFNMSTATSGGNTYAIQMGKLALTGSAAWAGDYTTWTPLMTTVTYSSTASGTDTSGTCILQNVQGSPQNVLWSHLTLVTDATASIYELNVPSNGGPNYQLNRAFFDSIFLTKPGAAAGSAAWENVNVTAPHEGTNTETFNYDVTSMSAYGLVWPGRTATYYTEYGNNPSYPDPALSPCTPPACSANSPLSWGFPVDTCHVGFVGEGGLMGWAFGCSGNPNAMLWAADWHNYALDSGSTYYKASPDDPTSDIGAHMAAIDAAETLNQYVCGSTCGSPGPFPDYPTTVIAPSNLTIRGMMQWQGNMSIK